MWILTVAAVLLTVVTIRAMRSGKSFVDFVGMGIVHWYARLWHRWSSNGPAPIPSRGPAIIVSNHTCSADPSFLTAGLNRPPSFMLAQEYYGIRPLRPLFDYIHCVPVTRNGRDANSVRAALRCLDSGHVLIIFPEGGLTNAGSRASLRAGKSGVALIALRSKAPVFPALITQGPQTNNILRAWLCPSKVHVTFGNPIDLSQYLDRNIDRPLLEEVTRYIMQEIAALDSRAHKHGRSTSKN